MILRPKYHFIIVRATIAGLASLCLFGWQQASAAQASSNDAPSVTREVSSQDVQVAEPFTFDLEVTAPKGTRIVMPALGSKLGDFDIIDQRELNDLPSESSPEQRIWTRRLTLESIVTGVLEIPSLEIRATQNGESEILKSNPISIRVISVLEDRADPTQFRDIHSVIDVNAPEPRSNSLIWWIAGGAGLSAFAAAAVAMAVRRKRWLTPVQWAIDELDLLKSSAAVASGESDSICRELSRIVRDYLELQFEIAAPEQTTDELLQIITSGGRLDLETQQQFGRIFEAADQVKFAGLQLSPQELDAMIDEAAQLVKQTGDLAELTSADSETAASPGFASQRESMPNLTDLNRGARN